MQNPFLLQNLKSQGLTYLLFENSLQKKEYSALALSLQKNSFVNKTILSPAQEHKKLQDKDTTLTQAQKVLEQANNGVQKTVFTPSTNKRTNKKSLLPQKPQDYPAPPLYNNVLSFDKWNKTWKEAHVRCKLPFERPKNLSKQIIWTYAGLEQDLFTDSPNADRRNVIANIIKALALPKGTHLFLPYKLFYQNDQQAKLAMDNESSFFWSAMDLVRPRVLIVFGQEALEDLELPPLLPTQKYTLSPITIFALDNILYYSQNSKENDVMINFLISNLKIFA